MAITPMTDNLNIIQSLADTPNDTSGLTAAQLKAKFDQAGITIQGYINNILLTQLAALGVENITRSVELTKIKYIRLNEDNVIETSTDGTTWQATGSSGHLILDTNGNPLPQRSRLKFAGAATVTDNGVETVVSGVQGSQGPQGIQGAQGIQGPQGPTGKSIIPSVDQSSGIMSFAEGPAGVIPSPVNVRGPQGVQGVQGPQGVMGPAGQQGPQGPYGPQGLRGDDGADGRSFVVKSLYATLFALQTAHPTGAEGDAYAVGTTTNNSVYIWDVDTSAWVQIGPIQGPQGPQGIQGIQGAQGIQGIQGPQGIAGTSAYSGAVSAGFSGTESQFNTALAAVPSKADKKVPAASGNLATLDASGNLADSGKKTTDFVAKTGDTMTGNLAIDTSSNFSQILLDTSADKQRLLFADNIGVYLCALDSNSTQDETYLIVKDRISQADVSLSLLLNRRIAGVSTNYKLYGEHNKPTAADIGGGIFPAAVGANPTAVASLLGNQVRNITAGTGDLVVGGTVMGTGDIYLVYE